jgi:cytochrome c oxidase assembly protein subunit 15
VSKFQVSQKTFITVVAAAAACYGLLVLTGGAVRLTGSGLGCPDWPSCYQHQFTSALSFHPIIEFGNRCITAAVSVISVLAYLFALMLKDRRRDLTWLSFGLVLGLVAQIILGGIVVLTKLNPYLVSLHFVLTFAVLANALVLLFHALYGPRGSKYILEPALVWLSRLLLGVLTVLVMVGTVVSGSGPHAGSPGTKRIPIAFRDIAEVHSDVALFLIGLMLATLFALHQAKVPHQIEQRGRLLLELMTIQGALGFTQYFLHDSAVVVEIHLAGATALWSAMIWFYLHLRPAIRVQQFEDARV